MPENVILSRNRPTAKDLTGRERSIMRSERQNKGKAFEGTEIFSSYE